MAPNAVVGHSLGELTEAAVAGVVELDDAVRLVSARAEAMAAAPAGAMLSVAAAYEDVLTLLPPALVPAAVNGPRQVVVAGTREELDAFAETLRAKGLACRHLRTSHAFHSPLMAAAADRFEGAFDGVALAVPKIPIYSAAIGRRMTDEEATSPAFWAEQLTRPVRFADAVEALFDDGIGMFVEAGPGRTLTSLVRQHPRYLPTEHVAVATLPDRGAPDERAAALEAVATVWTSGAAVDWRSVDQDAPVSRHVLRTVGPVYQFRHAKLQDRLAAKFNKPM